MKKAVYLELNHRDIENIYGDITGHEYDVFFDNVFIGTVCGNSYGPYGCNTGMFLECETTTPLTEIAERMNVELVDIQGKPIAKFW